MQSTAQSVALASLSAQGTLIARRRWFKLLGAAFRVFDQAGILVAYARQRAFRLRESLTVYADEAQTHPLFHIEARQVLDFGARYDVTDADTGAPIGSCRRRGVVSLFRDTWEVRDAQDQLLGLLEEDGLLQAFLRRYLLGALLPQTFQLTSGGSVLATFRQRFSLLAQTTELSVTPGAPLDGRLALAQLILLMAIEGRQQ